MTPELAKASAHAELAERFSVVVLVYQAFEEQVRFNMPAPLWPDGQSLPQL